MTNLGTYITELRQERGWSQRELARRAKFGATTLQQIESGDSDPSISTLVAIAEALKVAEQQLINAWKGKNYSEYTSFNELKTPIVEFVSRLPAQVVLEAVIANQKMEALIAEMAKRAKVPMPPQDKSLNALMMEALLSRPDEEVFENFLRVKGPEKVMEMMRKVRDEAET